KCGVTPPWKAGNILLGGGGRDIIEGKGGNDLIDGDSWLDVELVANLNDGTVMRTWDPRDLTTFVFSDPQQLNPGNIHIERDIRACPTSGCPAIDTAVDTAVFSGNRIEYDVRLNANGTVTVAHTRPAAATLNLQNGTDTLLNIEVLKFADTSEAAPGAAVRVVPNVVNLVQAAA